MTITVTTAAVKTAPSTGASSGGAAGPAQGGAGDLFASLLGLQLSSVGGLQGLGDGAVDTKTDSKDDKPSTTDASMQAVLAMPLAAAMQSQLSPVDVKQAAPDLLQQVAAKIDPTVLSQAKQSFNWQPLQQKLPDPDAANAQFLPLQAAQQAAQSNQQPQQVAPTNMPQLSLPQQLTDPSWGKALGEQVLGMVNLKMDKAQIQLNPPQLGPIEVTVKMNGNDQAQVMFTAAVPATREALENNMHRLSSMMSANGIQLTDSQVSSGQSDQQRQAYQQKKGQQQAEGPAEVSGVDALTALKAARGILSIFA
ncbi:flagellar hook-length control protein FliK [Chromobacterium sp. IIBBL 290-4]|uniref:flagellar hook-length control protein FliK n=1 Tax=Chromobacterium sp. IIBBL 290-4 TaxID=2953890 RepID=UPI0020B8CC8F|nr:flagellar hook-length control protein FliK [Chromobacterium sp. IIBBL 290-4]UTH74350.1 flagellar hook-length control protein FliK [Chromobacterium sp. IIBBL 290-4]